MTLAIIILGYLVFGVLLIDYLCPFWHPFEKLVGAVIWPIALGVGISRMVIHLRRERESRAVSRHAVFHMKSQIHYMDVCAGYRKGMWE